jgi:precorrin-6B methylase 2
MKQLLRELVKQNFPHFYWNYLIYKKLVLNKTSFLHQTGWYTSLLSSKPYTVDSEEIPWLNYGFINFLSKRLKEDFILFEYGSGASTSYFSKKVQTVVSVEHDEQWFNLVKTNLPNNVTLIFEPLNTNGTYCRLIHQFNNKFDIVLVDGRDRVNCIKESISKLSERGIIILDNSNRERYNEIFEWMENKEFKQITFTGILPGGFKYDATTVFYKYGNCLEI